MVAGSAAAKVKQKQAAKQAMVILLRIGLLFSQVWSNGWLISGKF
jgi:hypothetical protein